LCAFGIDNGRGITLMTDGGSAFEALADVYQFRHVLCVYHFTRNIFGTTCKMSNDLKDLYLNECADLVHKKFNDQSVWYEKWNTIKGMVVNFPDALSYLNQIFEKREKVCWTFSIWHFTANCKSTQRSESVNSLVKQNGRMKNALKTMEIEDLMLHMDALVSHQDRQSILEIQKCLGANKLWSSFVDEKWKLEQLHINECAAGACMSNDKVITVYCLTEVHATKWSVVMPEQDSDVPTCQCHHFSNTKIPCRHIGTAFWYLQANRMVCPNLQRREFFDARNLCPRWRVSNHPMYSHVVGSVEVASSKMDTEPSVASSTTHLYMTADEFQKLAVPSQSSVRYAKINETFNPLKELGKLSEFKYKIVLGNARKFVKAVIGYIQAMDSSCEMQPPSIQNVNQFHLHNAESISNMEMVLKPAAVNNRQTDTTNHAKRNVSLPCPTLAQKKKRQSPACSACIFYTGSEVTTHRAYSK
jgi:hypothetical protein